VNAFTLDEHRELSREMRQTTRRLRTLCELAVNVYGPQSRLAFSFQRAIEDVERLNQDLKVQATQDGFPGNDLYV
jgi:hypothetical protein